MRIELHSLVIEQGRPRFEATADGLPILVLFDTSAILALAVGPADQWEAAFEGQRARVRAAAARLWAQGFTTETEGHRAIIVTSLDL